MTEFKRMELEIKVEIIGTYWLCFAGDHVTGPCATDVGRFKYPKMGMAYIWKNEGRKWRKSLVLKRHERGRWNRIVTQLSLAGRLLLPAVIDTITKFLSYVECGEQQVG